MTVTFEIPDECRFISYTLVATGFNGLDSHTNILVSGFDPRDCKACIVKMQSITSDMETEIIPRERDSRGD